MDEVAITIPTKSVHQFLLIGRRLQAYADMGMLANPDELEQLGGMILKEFPEEVVKWLDAIHG